MNFDSWALTLAVFLPAVGVVVMLLIPQANEELRTRSPPSSPPSASLGVGIYLLVAVRLRPTPASCSSSSTSPGST